MSVKRSIALTGAGAVSSAAALVASPGTYAWLRRRLGLERGQDHYEVEAEQAAPHAEESLAEARLSLRARLAEAAAPVSAAPPAPTPLSIARPAPPSEVEDSRRLRLAVDATRARAREKAASALDGDDRSAAG